MPLKNTWIWPLPIQSAKEPEISVDSSSIHITGASWQKPGEGKQVGISSMVSKILCETHNNGMADYDAAAQGFFSFLRPRSRKNVEVNGSNLEKWLVKTLVGLFESGSLKSPIEGFSLKSSLYEYLFCDAVLEPPMGLTLVSRTPSIRMEPDLLVGPYFDESKVFSYVFNAFSIEVHLPFENLNLPYTTFFRPIEILKRTKDGEFKMSIKWKDGMVKRPAPFLTIVEKDESQN